MCACVSVTLPNAGLCLVAPVGEAHGAESYGRRMEQVKAGQPSPGTAAREGRS